MFQRIIVIAFFALASLSAMAQNYQLSLSGTYGYVLNDRTPHEEFNAFGTALGFEVKGNKHFTFGGEVDWQRFESILAITVPVTNPNIEPQVYSIDRHQFNIRPTIRYYFKEAFHGLYVGIFGTYSYLTITTSDYPQDPSFLPSLYTDPSDDFGSGAGLTYGYRLKLNGALQVSAFGSHQLFWNDIPKYQQQDHQFGLGLNWTF